MIPLSSCAPLRPSLLRGMISTRTAALRSVSTVHSALSARPPVALFGGATVSSFGAGSISISINNNQNNMLSGRRSFSGTKTRLQVFGEGKEDPYIEALMTHNRAWVDKMNETDPDFFPTLGKGQSPEYLYIGCSDSRVAISALTGLNLGEVFVHRNIANMVVSADLNLLSVLTYAVEHLKVKHILVTGHYDCGGIRASVQIKDYGQVLDAWLQNIRDVYRLHHVELDAIQNEECRHRRLVELNVLEQCLNLYKTGVVQRRRLVTYADPDSLTYPRIHGLVFDPATGVLKKIPIDFRHEISELSKTYDLFDVADFEKSLKEDYVLEKKPKATK